MSLVVLSSEQQNNGDAGQLGIEKPYSFQNYFQQPIRVPKNSRVALQSIRFQDSRTVSVGKSSNFHILIGDELDRSTNIYLEDTPSFPIVSYLASEKSLGNDLSFPPSTFSPLDFSYHFANIMNKYTLHPEFEGKQTVTLKRNASDQFEGFNFNFDQFNSSGSDITSPETFEEWISRSSNFSYNSGSNIFKRTASKSGGAGVIFDSRCIAIGTDAPLSLAGGEIEFQWVGTQNWRVGLTRPTTVDKPEPFGYEYDGDISVPFEICVQHVNNEIKLFQPVLINGETKMKEIDVENASTVNTSFSGSTPTRSPYKKVRIKVENEKVSVYLLDGTGNASTVMTPVENIDLRYTTKALNQNQWYLYPKIQLANQNQEMKITKYMTHGDGNYYERSYFSGCLNGVFRNGPAISQSIDQRQIFDYNITTQDRTYRGLNGSGGVDVKVTMIVGDDILHDPNTTLLNPDNSIRGLFPAANVTRMLGFDPYAVLNSTYNSGTNSKTIYTSIQTPQNIDISHPLLVRLNGLPITTYNGAKSATSKIIYSIGKYEADTHGVVYVIPPELIYIDIGNTEEMSISQLGVDLVTIFEKYKTGITGKSVITLCIKPKEEKY
jgi:hypothetical protein